MKISEYGLCLIKRFEGLRLQAYRCSAGVWTIGYGHTVGVHTGDVIDELQADVLLLQDVAQAARNVNQRVNAPLNQNQSDALISFVFNTGSGNFGKSTLLKKLNDGDYSGAADEFSRWVHAGGESLPGLVRRREAERKLFMDGHLPV